MFAAKNWRSLNGIISLALKYQLKTDYMNAQNLGKKKDNPEVTTVKFSMSITERLSLQHLKISKGSIIENEMADSILKKINFSESEIKEFKMSNEPDGKIYWDVTKAKNREFQFETYEVLLMQSGVRMHDEEHTIPSFANELAKRILGIELTTKKES